MKEKIAVLLVNLGTPDSPKTLDVGRYLFQFLNDKRVIDIPWLLRKILVNLIIVPFRAPKSAKIYKDLWTEKGSPTTQAWVLALRPSYPIRHCACGVECARNRVHSRGGGFRAVPANPR